MSKVFGAAQAVVGLLFASAGPPVAGVNEVQSLTSTATGGSPALTFGPYRTAALPFNATAAQVQAALAAIPAIGAGNVACAGGPLGTAAISVTFQGALAGLNLPQITADNSAVTGGAVASSTATQGVAASFRGCTPGALVTDTTNGVLYINTGSATLPVWTKVGTQS